MDNIIDDSAVLQTYIMGYYLQAFICKQADTSLLTICFNKAVKVDIGQGLNLIPLTEELFDQINNFHTSPTINTTSPAINTFVYLTEHMEQEILTIIGDKKLAYVEAEYFGGKGGQMAIVWNGGKREQLLGSGQNRINQVLKDFGVVAKSGQDEFLTMGFALHRYTKEWIESPDQGYLHQHK